MLKYIRGWYEPKNGFQNLWEALKSPLIWQFIELLRSKKFTRKILPSSGIKIVFFLNGPKPIQAGHSEDMFTHSISKPQQRPKNRRLLPLLTNFGKKSLSLHHMRFISLFSIYLLWLSLHDPSNGFCFCKFFAKGLKSEGERLKVKFWSSKMVKIGRGQHNYRRCCHHHRLQSFVMMKTTM